MYGQDALYRSETRRRAVHYGPIELSYRVDEYQVNKYNKITDNSKFEIIVIICLFIKKLIIIRVIGIFWV